VSNAASAVRARRPSLWSVLASPKMLAIALLGAASGFPNQLTESALQGWLSDAGANVKTIGLMTYVALPYLAKPLWAPFIDRYPLPLLGRRRGWIAVMQLALAGAIALMALQDPHVALEPVALCALLIVFCSATQDIAVDAWRTDVSLPEERGPAAAATNLGYRSAAWLASAFAFIAAGFFGWRRALLVLAVAMALFVLATWRAPEPHYQRKPPRSLTESIVIPLRELLGSPSAGSLIAVVLLFKVGDAFGQKLFTPFMKHTGFTNIEIGALVKVVFTGSTLAGVVIGGVLMVRLGLLRSMLVFGVLQALSNLLYCVLAAAGKSYPIMIAAVAIEHLAAAMGNIALVALIMAMCDRRYSAAQYALLSALALVPRYTLGYPAGWVAFHAGWYTYYVVSFALALPGLAIVWFMRGAIDALDREQDKGIAAVG